MDLRKNYQYNLTRLVLTGETIVRKDPGIFMIIKMSDSYSNDMSTIIRYLYKDPYRGKRYPSYYQVLNISHDVLDKLRNDFKSR